MMSSLRGSAFLVVVLDSKHFVESTMIILIEGVLFLLFAMQLNCFSGPTIKGPGGSEWVVGIGIYDGIKESFLQSFFEEGYGANVVEWYPSISSDSFEV
jgi:hypothetical protein